MNQLRKPRTQAQTKPEYLDAFVLRAERAGFTAAFVNVDCVVNAATPDFLVVPPRIADRVQAQYPSARRLSLEELKTFIENKVGAKREETDAEQT
jgi:hypothetical protein